MSLSSGEILRIAIDHFMSVQKESADKSIRFPSSKRIRTNPAEHFSIIVEQANKVISNKGDCMLSGLRHWDEDKVFLESFFAREIIQFITEEKINIPGITSATYAQTTIPAEASFNIARSRLLTQTYASIELANHTVAYQTFSIPFLIRLAIENKLKSVIGFVKSDIVRPKTPPRLDTQEFPVSVLIQELKRLKCLNLPCNLDDLQEIYNWSCRFCHTGKKEYLWLNLKALEVLAPLFSYEEHFKCQIEIQTLWGVGVLTPESMNKKTIEHKGPCLPLYYLKKGWCIQKLERTLNNTKNPSLKPYRFYLSESALDERSAFYCSKSKAHI
ncbi:hypothetical protein K5D42_08390 [Pseudomonas cichorii]|nr:hypothetical protein [Pseudomonas cichorii]MBX8489871.1 hypothetical protein [Pseudomonas cichorii]MBX8519206.1 hypothetical protein [Pseudomonas cichorii]MBX8568153.1 hypothetical protein [Pseudomonas cichorii]